MKFFSLLLSNSFKKFDNRVKHVRSLPSFPSDHLPKVYHDAVHGPLQPARRNQSASVPSISDQSDSSPASAVLGFGGVVHYSKWSNTREVTNHVGELGVMSRLAIQFREEERLNQATGNAMPKEEEAVRNGYLDKNGYDKTHNSTLHHDQMRDRSTHAPPQGLQRTLTTAQQPSSGHPSSRSSSGVESSFQKLNIITSLDQFRAVRKRAHAKRPPTESHTATGEAGLTMGNGEVFGVGRRSPRYSGVQLEILSMYRRMLKEVSRMRDESTRVNLKMYIRSEFDKNVVIPRKHVAKIEWCINTAKRKLEELRLLTSNTKFQIKR